MKVLNVGGGGNRVIPAHYAGFEQLVLDIDESVGADIVCDALEMVGLEPEQFESVYCSHNLEHFYQHDVPQVLKGFLHVLKSKGSLEIHVPNLKNLMTEMMKNNLDLMDVWYRVGDTPITYHDVLYGWNTAMKDGNLYYAHKCGFTSLSLFTAIERAGFVNVCVYDQGANLVARALKE